MASNYTESTAVTANTDATADQYNDLRADAVTWNITKVKTADESVTSSTTLQDDDDLRFAIGANENWSVTLHAVVSAGNTPDFKWKVAVPTGAVFNGGYLFKTGGAGGTDVVGIINDFVAFRDQQSSDSQDYFQLFFYVNNGSTAGDVKFQFAQNTSNGTATTVKKGSVLTARRVA